VKLLSRGDLLALIDRAAPVVGEMQEDGDPIAGCMLRTDALVLLDQLSMRTTGLSAADLERQQRRRCRPRTVSRKQPQQQQQLTVAQVNSEAVVQQCDVAESSARWAVVHTHPQAERWAAQNLNCHGYTTYLPLVTIRRRDRVIKTLWHAVEAPLFARYLFLRFDSRQSWRPVRYTPGVDHLLKMGDQLSWVADDVISALQASEAARRSPPTDHGGLAPGTACKPVAGAFKGHEAVVVQLLPNGQALILLLVFGHPRQVLIPCAHLDARAG
jgi:transcription antitermination factor NusG